MNISKTLHAQNIDALFVTKPENVRYVSNFTDPDGDLVITKKDIFLLTDFRTIGQAVKQAPECMIVDRTDWRKRDWAHFLRTHKIHRLGFEARHMTFDQHTRLKKISRGVRLVPLGNVIEKLRAVKDVRELAHIRNAVRIAESAFRQTMKRLRVGMTEIEIAWRMEKTMRNLGADGHSFPTIVAAGPHSANPHHANTKRKIRRNEFIILDFGVLENGYCSDITRTIFLGKPSAKHQHIFDIVLKAQKEALKKMKKGEPCSVVDKAARDVIQDAGFGEYFGHALGHGVGLEVHEAPTLSSRSKEKLQIGNVVTNEPGIYIPHFGGVRLEDDVLITASTPKVLSKLPRTLAKK